MPQKFGQFDTPSLESEEKKSPYEIYIEKQIDFFTKKSSFEHEKLSNGREKIKSPEGEEFIVRSIESPKDPAVKRIHELMIEEFGREESERLSWIRESIKRKLNDYNIIESLDGELLGFTSSQYLEMEKKNGSKNKRESFVYLCFIVTTEEARGKGIGTELSRRIYSDTLNRARQEGHEVKGFVGEAVDSVEVFTNKMGRKRVYFKDNEGNIHEVPYFCPPVEMDSETGEPNDEIFPEHLMLSLTNGGEFIENNDLLRMLKRIYIEYLGEESDYNSTEAYRNAYKYNMELLAKLEVALNEAKDGKCFLMSREEREKMAEKMKLGDK